MKKLTRRQLLASSGVIGAMAAISFNPIRELVKHILNGQISSTQSRLLKNTISIGETRNYVHFNLYGGPSRWFFDHILRPSDSDGFVQGKGVYNKILKLDQSNPHLSQGIYSDVKINGINMPSLWNEYVAHANGGSRKMSELMNNMLMIRGCDTKTEAHPINNSRLVAPVPGGVSLTGLVADRSRALISAISVGSTPATRAYKSQLNIGVVDIPSSDADYISFLLNVFYDQNKNSFRDNIDIDLEINAALSELQIENKSTNNMSNLLYEDRKRAEVLIRKGIKDLGDVFGPLVMKYQDLFHRSMFMSPISGVNESIIPGLKFPCSVNGDLDTETALGSHHLNGKLICHSDLRSIFKTVESQNLAKHFAIAEFALTEGLSSSIMLASPQERGNILIGNIPFDYFDINDIEKKYDKEKNRTHFNVKDANQIKQTGVQLENDSHQTGWIMNVVTCSMFYKGFSSCMLELVDQLKKVKIGNNTLFDETVIHIASEFDRVPTKNGSGYSHNASGQVTSLISGAINQTLVLGNIYISKKNDYHPEGTIGDAAPIESLPNKIININNISSTVSELLRAPRIVKRGLPLVKVDGNKTVAAIEWAKNVEYKA
jgi:hypothetical protein